MRGQTAPLAAIDAVEAATKLTFADGLKCEAELFDQCLRSPQSKALISSIDSVTTPDSATAVFWFPARAPQQF